MKLPPIRAHRKFAALALLALLPSLPSGSQAKPQQSSALNQKPNENSAQKEDPAAPLLAQAQDALDRKDYAAAAPLLEKVVAAKPTDALPHFDLGVAYSQLKRNPEAIAESRQAISLDANYAPAHLNLGLLLLDSDPAAAAASFERAAQLDGDGTVSQMGAMHVMRWDERSKPTLDRVFSTDQKPKAEGTNCERCHPSSYAVAAPATC